jgi:aminopeptidase N
MWLNEGWASYSEHLFTEKVYGQAAFRKAVRDNHLNVLQNAHVAEGGYRAVTGLPHNLTYGTHTYNRGASVAHNLRGYLGDSTFRLGCRSALADTRFKDWSSSGFRDKLEAATGIDLHDFFEDWVFSGGYPDYSVDSVKYFFSPVDAPTIVRVFVKQKKRGTPRFHQNVPLEFTFMMPDGQFQRRMAIVSGEHSTVEFLFPAWGFTPMKIFVNTDQKILQARSEGEKWVKTTGAHNFSEAKWAMSVNSLGGADSVFCRVEHHFAAPDDEGANPNGYKLSNRYWSLHLARSFHQPTSGFDAQAILNYDGRGQLDQLDTELFAATGPSEDSVLLLYRPGPGHPWKEFPTYTKLTLGSTTDRWGQLRPTKLVQGEYTIGKGVSALSQSNPQPLGKVLLSPNPTSGYVWVKSEEPFHAATLIGADGKTEKTWHSSPTQETALNLEGHPSGTYWLLLEGAKGAAVLPFVKKH